MVRHYLTIIGLIVITILTGCKKKEAVPIITTSAISNITGTTATSGGNITDEGSSTVLSRGVCWSTGTTPTTADSKTSDGAGAGSFSSNITGLNGATNYFVRAYATNGTGTGYGMEMSITTLGQSPTPMVAAATNLNSRTATLNGSVNANYLSTVVTFEYGTTTTYGNTATATQSPVTGNTVTNVSADITGLTAGGTTYHFRVKAINSGGTTYSNDITFTTLGQVPTVNTLAATNLSIATAQLNGTVNANYLSTVVSFDYGTTPSYGSTATAIQSPITGSTITNVSANITGLSEFAIYHFRVKAVNSLGTTTGDDFTFKTSVSSSVTDVEGNIYKIVTIGTQTWMAENLKTIKYNDGTTILNVADYTAWAALTTGAYCDYSNTSSNSTTYGRLYNWYAVDNNAGTKEASNGGKNVCPTGWHVPTDAEWTTLTDYLTNNGYGYGGSGSDIGKSMASTSGWTTDPTAGTVGNDQASNNSSGFTALPGGYRKNNGAYDEIGNGGGWWSSTEGSTLSAMYRSMYYNNPDLERVGYYKQIGFSVRCLQD